MNHPSPAPSDDNADGSKGVRTVSEARRWFATLQRNGVTEVRIQEPFREVGGGLVIVQASLLREDGARVNVAVYCYDDTPPPAVVDWLPPLPKDGGESGWFDDGGGLF